MLYQVAFYGVILILAKLCQVTKSDFAICKRTNGSRPEYVKRPKKFGGFSDAAGVVDSVAVQRSGPPADVSLQSVSNTRISAVITASTKGKLPRLQTLIVHKSDKSTAICEDGVEVLP